MKAGDYVVVRSSQAGVFGGELVEISGDSVTLKNARKAWRWSGAFGPEGLAIYGPSGGKLTAEVAEVRVLGACQILLATYTAAERWRSVEEHKP